MCIRDSPQGWTDPAPLSEKAFYRLSATSILAQTPQLAQSPIENPSNEEEIVTAEVKEVILECTFCDHSDE